MERTARALQRFLHFTTLLKPDVYLSLITLVRRTSPASVMITHPGSGEITIQQVLRLAPCTTSEMFHWLEADLAVFSKWNRGTRDAVKKEVECDANEVAGTAIESFLGNAVSV